MQLDCVSRDTYNRIISMEHGTKIYKPWRVSLKKLKQYHYTTIRLLMMQVIVQLSQSGEWWRESCQYWSNLYRKLILGCQCCEHLICSEQTLLQNLLYIGLLLPAISSKKQIFLCHTIGRAACKYSLTKIHFALAFEGSMSSLLELWGCFAIDSTISGKVGRDELGEMSNMVFQLPLTI